MRTFSPGGSPGVYNPLIISSRSHINPGVQEKLHELGSTLEIVVATGSYRTKAIYYQDFVLVVQEVSWALAGGVLG